MGSSRRSVRLQGYDYAEAGAYFVTVCTHGRLPILGDVHDGFMDLSALAEVVAECWRWLGEQYRYVAIDEFVVMPDHLHGIVLINDTLAEPERGVVGRGGAAMGGSRTAPTGRLESNERRKPLGRLVGAFKTISTKRVNALRGEPGAQLWQRNYYEHVIRGERALNRIRQYIIDNPMRWHDDPEDREVFREFGIKPTAR